MSNNKQPQTVTIDDTTYDINAFTQEQRALLEHCVDLDRKLASCLFQADQLRIGKDAFMSLLKQRLAEGADAPVDAAAEVIQ